MSLRKRLLVVATALGAGTAIASSAGATYLPGDAGCASRFSRAEGEAAPLARRMAQAGCETQYTRSTPKKRYGRGRPVKCFLTSACCDLADLPDDCFELQVLRRFRDDILAGKPGGQADIDLYYDVGPRIAEALGREGEERALARVYAGTILPCVGLILVGAHDTARTLYTRMVRDLMERYGIAATA